MSGGESGVSDPLESVTTWDVDGNPYWNAVVKSAGKPLGVGKVHKARVEDGRVVEVECHARVESWVVFGPQNQGEKRQICLNCNLVNEVPGVEPEMLSRVRLTEDYNPGRYRDTDNEP